MQVNPKIRKMLSQDTSSIIFIEKRISSDPWSEKLFKDCIKVKYSCWVITVSEEVIGYGIMSCDKNPAHILTLTISEKWQGKGLGSRMMKHLIQLAKQKRMASVKLEVRESNKKAFNLYNKLNFKVIATKEDYYPSPGRTRENALVLELEL